MTQDTRPHKSASTRTAAGGGSPNSHTRLASAARRVLRASGWLVVALGFTLALAPVSPSTAAAASAGAMDASPLDLATLIGPLASPDKLWAADQNVISVSDATCMEGELCKFTVTLTNGQPGVTNVFSYRTVDGSAKSDQTVPRPGADYHFSNGTDLFGPGMVTGTIPIAIETFKDSALIEYDETFTVQIVSVGNLNVAGSAHAPTVGRTVGTGTIQGLPLVLNPRATLTP